MEKNDEIKTVHSPTKRFSKKLLIAVGVVVVLLVAGAAYLATTLINQNADKDKKTAEKPKLVAPVKVMKEIESTDKTLKASHDQHSATKAAFDEKPVKLVD